MSESQNVMFLFDNLSKVVNSSMINGIWQRNKRWSIPSSVIWPIEGKWSYMYMGHVLPFRKAVWPIFWASDLKYKTKNQITSTFFKKLSVFLIALYIIRISNYARIKQILADLLLQNIEIFKGNFYLTILKSMSSFYI